MVYLSPPKISLGSVALARREAQHDGGEMLRDRLTGRQGEVDSRECGSSHPSPPRRRSGGRLSDPNLFNPPRFVLFRPPQKKKGL